MSGARLDAVVIGAGHNGLVAAAYLAQAGLRVRVLERRGDPGGCAATEEAWPGYRVDAGADGLTALDARVVRDLGLAGGSEIGLEWLAPDPCAVAPLPDGEAVVLWRDPGRTAEGLRRFSPRDAARWPEFAEAMERAARVLEELYRRPAPKLAGAGRRDLWDIARLGARLGRIGRRDALELMRLIPMSIEELLYEWFESESLKGALAVDAVRGLRQGPLASGTGYLFLHHMVGAGRSVRARRRVRGGMGALGEALRRRAAAAGAEVRLGADVSSIIVEDGRATGVELADGERIEADRVASSADPGRTLLGLVDPGELDPEFTRALENVKYRGALAKVHLALAELPRLRAPDADAAARAGAWISVAPSLHYIERAHDEAKYGRWSARPVVDAVLTTALDPELAPEGRHILSATVQYAPCELRDGPWDAAQRDALGDAAVAALAEHMPGLESAILHRQVLAPSDLADRFALTEGSVYHGDMTLDQILIGRPVPGWARHRTPIEGLYLCGAGSHPGGGLTGRPGALAAARILRDRRA